MALVRLALSNHLPKIRAEGRSWDLATPRWAAAMLTTPKNLPADVPSEWFLQVIWYCITDLSRSLSAICCPGRTLTQVAKQLPGVRCGKQAQQVVLVDDRTPESSANFYPPRTVRMVVLEGERPGAGAD